MQCPQCGGPNRDGARFCDACGTRLGDAVAAPAAPVYASPAAYTPRHLAERILTSRTALEGERKLVTVVFCDIANSTALAEAKGAEAMYELLNRFFDLALAEVHRYEGTINQFLGDGYMALFGAPVAHEDHARRAVLAALGVRRRLADGEDPALAGVRIRTGINTGLVVVGKIGDNLRMDYTAVGDTTNLAARLQQHAEPGTMLVSDATHRLIRGYVRAEALPPLTVKGKTEPVTAWRVDALGPRRSPIDGLGARSLSPFVGREREIEVLGRALADAEAGRARVVGLVSDAGAGKSRLLLEFRRTLGARRVTYLQGDCMPYATTTPYLPLQDVLRDNCRIVDEDTPEAIVAKVHGALGELDMDPAEFAPYVLRLLGVKTGAESLDLIGPETIQPRTFETIRQMTLRGSRRRPLVVAIEDLHWVDRVSESCLAMLVESLLDAPILFLASYRSSYRPPWTGAAHAEELPVSPLDDADARTVMRSVVRRHELAESLAHVILAKAEGNPFFLEELARVVVDERGVVDAGVVPDTIQGVLTARIDRLPEEAKRLLQTAAILGREFPLTLLEAIWDGAAPAAAHLPSLTGHDFLHERPGASGTVVVFKHALTQDVAYDTLLTGRRQALHEAAGRALERLWPERREENAELLAYHFTRSADAAKALEYLERANAKAAAANAMVEAKGYFDDAVRLLAAQPAGPERDRCRIGLLTRQMLVFRLLFKYPEYHELLEHEVPVAERLGDPALLGVLYARLGYCLFGFGRYDEAIDVLRRAAALCEESANHEDAAQACMVWQWSHLYRGDFDEAHRLKDDVLRHTARGFHLSWHVHALCGGALASAWTGRWRDAVAEAEAALALAERYGSDGGIVLAANALTIAYTAQGDIPRALGHGQRAVERAPTPVERAVAQLALSWAWCRAGEPKRAAEALAPFIMMARASRHRSVEIAAVYLAEAQWRAGEYAEAVATLEEGIRIADECGMKYARGLAERLLGEVRLAMNPAQQEPPLAAPHFERAIALLGDIGAENELAEALAGHGRVHALLGRKAEARVALTRALAIFERLGTLGAPDEARATLAACDAP